jgi:2-polyprenyl-6-methoxyphenol hydroxylase-like FAD-dependent oxidoreductase
MSQGRRVLVVGAGPTGVLTALGLARAGAEVTIIEREPDIVGSPRATVYMASTLKVLDELGLLGEARESGAIGYEFNQRFKLTGHICRMDHRLIADLTPYAYTLHFGQDQLARLALRHFMALPGASVLWNTSFGALAQHGDVVSVDLETPTGRKALEFDWVIGADGSRSAVRPAMGASFDGFTWPETFMATNVYYDFESLGWVHSNMVADAENWAVIARLNKEEHFWRISYSERGELSEEQRLARIPERYRILFPDSRPWRLDRANSYRVHQRSASAYRIGRVLLAGDAAHATNPIGGMGLTSGVQDASGLISAFAALFSNQAGEDVLDWYAYERRRCFLEIANPSAIEFKRRTQEADPARRLEDERNFFAMMENRELHRAALMSLFELCGRPYRPDWREALVPGDRARTAGRPLVLGADMAARIKLTAEIEASGTAPPGEDGTW